MEQDRIDAHGIRDSARMLPACAAEADERVFGRIVAALDRDLFDRLGHVEVSDGEEAFSGFFRRELPAGPRFNLGAECSELFGDDAAIQGLISVWPEDRRKKLRPHAAEEHVAISDCQRSPTPIAGGPGEGAGALGADTQTRAVERADRAAAGRDRMHLQHRRGEANACYHRFVRSFKGAGEVRDIGGGAAHVEAERVVEPRTLGRRRHADNAAGGAGEYRVAATEGAGAGEAAVRLHEEQVRIALAAEAAGEGIDVFAQHRREISVRHRCIGARYELDEAADLRADRDLCKTDVARDGRQALFVRGVSPTVQTRDSDSAEALSVSCPESRPRMRLI